MVIAINPEMLSVWLPWLQLRRRWLGRGGQTRGATILNEILMESVVRW